MLTRPASRTIIDAARKTVISRPMLMESPSSRKLWPDISLSWYLADLPFTSRSDRVRIQRDCRYLVGDWEKNTSPSDPAAERKRP